MLREEEGARAEEEGRELEREVRGELLFKGYLMKGKNGIFTAPAFRVFRE